MRSLSPLQSLSALVMGTVFGWGSAQAATLTQQVSVDPITFFTAAPIGTLVSHPITATFDQFDASLGTLTGVSFDYKYVFSSSIVVTNGGGGGSARVSGPLKVAGQAISGNGNSGAYGFTVQGSLTPVMALDDLIGLGTYEFTYEPIGGFDGGGSPGAVLKANLALIAPSSVTVNYTYDVAAAVPEPGSLALVAAGGLVLVVMQRRKNGVAAQNQAI